MTRIKTLELVVGACFVAASVSAWSQPGEAGSASVGAQASFSVTASGAAAPVGRKADRALRRRVYAAIAKDKEINAGDISVVARDGVLTLNGTVTEAAQIGKTEAITKGVSGVRSVINKLTVKKPLGGM